MGGFYIHLLLKMHYLLILLTAPYCHWYQNYLPFHSLESVKETKKENSTNQFALIESISLYTLYTVKKKKKWPWAISKILFVYDMAQKDFNFADQQSFNLWEFILAMVKA